MKNIILLVKQKTTGLAISDCYRRSIACSVTLVTAVQICTGAVKPPEFEPVGETKDNRGCSA